MDIRDVKEVLPGGWHTVRRVFLPAPSGPMRLVCPGCGNSDPDKFKTVASGATLEGFLCMACTR